MFNTNDDITATDSNAGLKPNLMTDSEAGLEADFNLNNTNKVDLVSEVLITEVDKS